MRCEVASPALYILKLNDNTSNNTPTHSKAHVHFLGLKFSLQYLEKPWKVDGLLYMKDGC